jgi:hypothetical protein
LVGFAQRKAEESRADIRRDKEQAADALRQLKEDAVAAQSMKNEIDVASAKKYLEPTDRLRAAQTLERRAAEFGLTNLAYTMGPEQKVSHQTVASGAQEVALSLITLSANAPSDTDVYAFFDALSRTIPGRVSLREISLQRLNGVDAPIAEANVRLDAQADWLSNGAAQTLTEAKP